MKTKTAPKGFMPLDEFPNFHRSGSIKGMKELYYGKNALLIRHGNYIYNVTGNPEIYNSI